MSLKLIADGFYVNPDQVVTMLADDTVWHVRLQLTVGHDLEYDFDTQEEYADFVRGVLAATS